MKERDIPAGWDLSATLALFRNLAIMDASTIPETSGDVYFSREEVYKEDQGQIFTNTYHFFRKTSAGKFLKFSVVEEHRLAAVDINAGADDAVRYHRVADLSQSASVVDSIPGDAKVRKQLSVLLGYIFDHQKVLAASKAGEMARKLNYKSEGRFRPPDYKQPRVSYLEKSPGTVAKVRIFGLSTLLNERTSPVDKGDPMDNKVMEFAVDDSGNAQVSMDVLKR